MEITGTGEGQSPLIYMIPAYLHKYFWEVDIKKIDKNKSKDYIIARILEYGDIKALRWLLQNYQARSIKNVLMKSRQFSEKTANFWAQYFDLDKNKVLCLNKSFLKRRRTHWIY